MNNGLSGKTAIITGGSRGYGYGIAEALKNEGAQVWITGRREAELKQAAGALEVNCQVADVTVPSDWDRLVDTVISHSKSIDILINNAGGVISSEELDGQTDKNIIDSVALNLTGVIYGCKRVVPFMKKQRFGTIINISSICAREAWPGWAVYSAAKAGLEQFSKCLYLELQDFGVRVSTLIPSWGATNFRKAAGLDERDAETEAKVTKPCEIGEIVIGICSLPAHLEILDLTVLPMVQKIVPL